MTETKTLLDSKCSMYAITHGSMLQEKKKVKFVAKPTPEKIREVIELICNLFEVTEEQLKGDRGEVSLSSVRQIAMYVVYMCTTLNKSATARVFNRDHTTVIHALRVVANMMSTNDKKFNQMLDFYKANAPDYLIP